MTRYRSILAAEDAGVVLGVLGVAVSGGIATAPLAASVCGWIAHWNAYVNTFLLLSSVALWLTNLYALREALRAARADQKEAA